MNEFGEKGYITDKDFNFHVFKNVPKDYDLFLDELENCLMATGTNALTINMICKKINHWYKKIKSKNKEKKENKKALGAYNKQYKQSCCVSVVSTTMNLVIKNVLKIKMKNI